MLGDDPYPFRVESVRSGGTDQLIARNDGPVPVSLVVRLLDPTNVTTDVRMPVVQVIRPKTHALIARVFPANRALGSRYSYKASFRLGSFHASHDPAARYRLPYLDGRSFMMTQTASGFRTTHTEPYSREAVDISMPEGTPILAARAGIVIEAISKYVDGAKDLELLAHANSVRILHDDGTIATYGHLMPGGTSVRRGELVPAGKLIGYAGSTGYSSGPHLHFVVNRVIVEGDQLQEVSEPITFYVGKPPYDFLPRTGQAVTANYVSPGSSEMLALSESEPEAAVARSVRAGSQMNANAGPQLVIEVPWSLYNFRATWWWVAAAGLLALIIAPRLVRIVRREW